jgi:hypothetical protein
VPKLEDSRSIRCNLRICHTCARVLEELWTVIKSCVLNCEWSKLPSWIKNLRTYYIIFIDNKKCFDYGRNSEPLGTTVNVFSNSRSRDMFQCKLSLANKIQFLHILHLSKLRVCTHFKKVRFVFSFIIVINYSLSVITHRLVPIDPNSDAITMTTMFPET